MSMANAKARKIRWKRVALIAAVGVAAFGLYLYVGNERMGRRLETMDFSGLSKDGHAFVRTQLPYVLEEVRNGSFPTRRIDRTNSGATEVEVRISAVEDKIAAGNSLSIRVEIWNVGSQDLFICKRFHGVRMVYCDLELRFQPSVKAARDAWAADTIPDEKESVVDALTRNWTSIAPNHFYGSIIQLDPRSYPELNAPGHYRISGRFVSAGLLSSVYYNTLAKHPEEVAHLPGKSWKGDVETNSITVDVAPIKN